MGGLRPGALSTCSETLFPTHALLPLPPPPYPLNRPHCRLTFHFGAQGTDSKKENRTSMFSSTLPLRPRMPRESWAFPSAPRNFSFPGGVGMTGERACLFPRKLF